jgi:DNA repair protein RecN (Recombination protein N)
MLRRLEIDDFGLIARAEIAFDPGATIFTGETGSGKTMVLGALGFVLGERAGADVVRRGAARACVVLSFDPSDGLRERLDADGFPSDPGETISIVREMSEAGRSQVRLCGRPSTAAYVREIAEEVAEIVGQHEAQRLLLGHYQLDLLDRFAGSEATGLRSRVARLHDAYAAARAELEALQRDDRESRERAEDARRVRDEIDAAKIVAGQERTLDERRRVLENVERVAGALRSAHDALAGDDGGAIGLLGASGVALSPVAGVATQLGELASRAKALQSEAVELAAALAGELDSTEFDPAELDAINERLALLEDLQRRHGGSLEAVLEHRDRLSEVVDRYERHDELLATARAIVERAGDELAQAAAELSRLRREAGTQLAQRVVAEFGDLALASGRFDVEFEALDAIAAAGAERAAFVFAANAGELLRPLGRVASGGELSRVLLALVVVLAAFRPRTALIFDEIDAGIGGATAAAVGARLGRLARAGQVVCVTHLAQLATWADRHYVLLKHERNGLASIEVRPVEGQGEREGELARMLSGETNDAAIAHARALLAARG